MLRLIRKSGELVFNKDDAIMTRYAYGGYNGIVKNYGNECDYTIEKGSFKILSGEIIVDGWETSVDDAGWVFNPISTYGRQYYSVFLQINVLLETCEIKATYSQSAFPVINKGDDLTQIPNGTANLLLYNFTVDNGTISSVEKKFDVIQYANAKTINGIEIKEESNKVYVKDAFVERRKTLWENNAGLEVPYEEITIENLQSSSLIGKNIEFLFDSGAGRKYEKFLMLKDSKCILGYYEYAYTSEGFLDPTSVIGGLRIKISNDVVKAKSLDSKVKLYKIIEVI